MLQRPAIKTSTFYGRGEHVMCQYTNLEVIYISPSSKLLRGKDSHTGSWVVLKTGGQEHMTQEAAARLRREYQIMQRIDSPYVVKALGEVTLDERCYLVEEFCPGITLSRLLKQGALEMSDFYRIAKQLVMGLRDIHEAGIIHKDINPSNIMYDAESGRGGAGLRYLLHVYARTDVGDPT